ncbi:suppressor of hpr1 [Taxawa tesnikishii (nom. ined.)]|nr:suppressor of hpr1 [Dothideales sp. JES 119]
MEQAAPPPPPSPPTEPRYGGYTRFELELEFVQSLSNPHFLQHLATQKLFDDPAFVAYLGYLQYWSEPKYIRYLSWPGPTVRALELLQQEQFRRDILLPDVASRLINEGLEAITAGVKQ